MSSSALQRALSSELPPQTRFDEASGRTDRSVGRDGRQAMSLHVSKLRGISFEVRTKLKRHGVTYTDQLLAAAGTPQARQQLAAKSGVEEPTLGWLVRRADLARIKGVGAIFAEMLEMLGVNGVAKLAAPGAEHASCQPRRAQCRRTPRPPCPDAGRGRGLGRASTRPAQFASGRRLTRFQFSAQSALCPRHGAARSGYDTHSSLV